MARKKTSDKVVETTVTYLEMGAPPARATRAAPLGRLAILRAEKPTVSFYHYLYGTIGEPWRWTDRRLMNDEGLREIIHDPKVEIYVLYVNGVPAGFAELDRRRSRDVELVYFGLVPEFIGHGLGAYLLDWAVHQAWTYDPERVWVHTCTLDHPRALRLYQRAGFVAYTRQVERVTAAAAPSGGGSG